MVEISVMKADCAPLERVQVDVFQEQQKGSHSRQPSQASSKVNSASYRTLEICQSSAA